MWPSFQDEPLIIDAVAAAEGRIGMTACPGRKYLASLTAPAWCRNLQDDLGSIRQWGASTLVTLLETQELKWLGVAALPRLARQCGLSWQHLPIMDGHAPDAGFRAAWTEVGADLRARLCRGESLVLHCRGGLGRTGTITAQLLIELGECPPQEAIARVRAARPGAIEAEEQEAYLMNLLPPH